ncbi:MAG: aminotransferase class I/II-fold pyridoxal phosphate-dependent enzyme [Acidimicrobiia bacterium]|nr:aminotransferase class I/II-fold pyridoxal phosphate-dependent enzyme [Acidimicrobiia bacterium]
MRINPILASLGAYPMARLQDKARALRAAGAPLLDFSIGDPREPTPGFIPDALRAAIPEVSQYPTTAGLASTRQAIADYVLRRFGVVVDPDTQVIPTAGSKEAIFSTPLAFVDASAGDVVIQATPGYPIYERGALLAGARVHSVVLEDDFVFRSAMVPAEVWSDASMVWINNPHNPTGSVMSFEDLSDFYETARAHDVLLCADECYVDLYEGAPPASTLQVADDRLAGVLSFLSLSKRSGMTGYRAAAIVGDATAIEALKALRSSTGTASPEFVQLAAEAAWADDTHVAPRREIFAAKRAVLKQAFEDLGYEAVASRAGLYLWVRVGDDVAITERLLEANVVVSPGRAFGAGGEGYLRLALVPTLEECKAAVKVVQSCLTGN